MDSKGITIPLCRTSVKTQIGFVLHNLLRAIGFVWHDWPAAGATQIGFVLHNRLRGSQPGCPKLALFLRGRSCIPLVATPCLNSIYPPTRSHANWVCLAHLLGVPRLVPQIPQSAQVWLCCPKRCIEAMSHGSSQPRHEIPARPSAAARIALAERNERMRRNRKEAGLARQTSPSCLSNHQSSMPRPPRSRPPSTYAPCCTNRAGIPCARAPSESRNSLCGKE